MGFANRLVIGLLRSPAHRMLSGSTCVIRYSGRKTGRTFTTPTQYATLDGGIVIMAGRPDTKTWWRNFRGQHELDVLLDHTWVPMTGTARTGADDRASVEPLLDTYLARFPRSAKALPDDRDDRLASAVLVECHPR